MVMFKLKRCVAPSREEWCQQNQKDIQKVPLMGDESDTARERISTIADDIVMYVGK